MKKILLSLLLLATFAEAKFYAGVNAQAVSVLGAGEKSNFIKIQDGQDRMVQGGLVLGYSVSDSLAIETRLGSTFYGEDIFDVTTLTAFLKPRAYMTQNFAVYGLLGYGTVNTDYLKEESSYFNIEEGTFQYGLGFSVEFTNGLEFYSDYVVLGTGLEGEIGGYKEVDVNSLTIGLNYLF